LEIRDRKQRKQNTRLGRKLPISSGFSRARQVTVLY